MIHYSYQVCISNTHQSIEPCATAAGRGQPSQSGGVATWPLPPASPAVESVLEEVEQRFLHHVRHLRGTTTEVLQRSTRSKMMLVEEMCR